MLRQTGSGDNRSERQLQVRRKMLGCMQAMDEDAAHHMQTAQLSETTRKRNSVRS